MTEKNTQPRSREDSPNIRELLDMSSVDDFRSQQHQLWSSYKDYSDYEMAFHKDVFLRAELGLDIFSDWLEEHVDEFLKSKGIIKGSTHYDQLRDVYRSVSIDKQPQAGWKPNNQYSRNKPAGRDVFKAQLKVVSDALDAEPTSPVSPNSGLSEYEWGEVYEEKNDTLEKYGQLAGDLSKRMLEPTRTREAIALANEKAADIVSACATQMMDQLIAEGKSEAEIAEAIDVFVNAEANKLTATMADERMKEYKESSVFMQKHVYDRWARWTKEGKKGTAKKIAVSAFIGAPLAVANVASGGSVFAVSGAAAIVAVGSVTLFRSIGRKLARGHITKRADAPRLAESQQVDILNSYSRASNLDMHMAQEEYDELSEDEQKEMSAQIMRQRKTIFEVVDEKSKYYQQQNLRRAVGGTAISLTIGLLSPIAADWVEDHVDLFCWQGGGAKPEAHNTVQDDQPAEQKTDGTELNQEEPEMGVNTDPEVPSYTVTSGEGWYETFDNLGVDPDRHAELLRQIGPQLQELGVATPHDGSWWIAAPGELPDEATRLILETAQDVNLQYAASVELLDDVPVDVTSDFSVDKGEGLNEFVADNYGEPLMHDQSTTLGAQLRDQGVMYSSDHLADNYGNPYGLSEPGPIDQTTHDSIRDMLDDGVLNDSQSVEASPSQEVPAQTGSNSAADSSTAGEAAGPSAVESTPEPAPAPDPLDVLDSIEKGNLETQVIELIDSGNYSILNDIDSPTFQLQDLGAKLKQFNFTNETTPITEFKPSTGESAGKYMFNNQPAGYAIPDAAREVIVKHLENLSLTDGDASTITGLLQNAA